ncbi:hypothetical protein BOTBODRAFT_297889 [Botryobasidium botryosum FD-172 SS1]|uniref:Uncharacterized protein n=1 Tax=Botryobasidium botryosum (strain FD-172 SS1) TaxID=930990 RepID=A0A067MIE4_BOTB1|nr:hypothetical protein BOTBODRAFT_297889 [Botryobasidium botryosum FD-172 SS1]
MTLQGKVIWPDIRNAEIVHGDKYLEHALESLRVTVTTKPNRAERRLVEDTLGSFCCNVSREKTLRSICAAACQWGNLELWYRVVDACDGYANVEMLGVEYIVKAFTRFGCDVLLRFVINFTPSLSHFQLVFWVFWHSNDASEG